MKEIIYYEAEKVNAEGKTLYYYGVADLKYSIILYNKESEFKYDDITLCINKSGYLLIGEVKWQ